MDTQQDTKPWQNSLPRDGFTDAWLKKETARRDAPRREVGDRGSGLRARIEPSGVVTWVYYERMPGLPGDPVKRKKHRLGTWPQTSIPAARERVALIQKSKGGGSRLSDIHATSPFSEVVERFIEKKLPERKLEREAKEKGLRGPAELVIRRVILPTLGARPTALISTAEVVDVIEAVARGDFGKGRWKGKPAPTQAHNVLTLLSMIFNYAIGRDVIQRNPCDAADPDDTRPGQTRERCLSIEEIPVFWKAVADDKVPLLPTASLAVRLLLVTGVRKSELLKAKWTNVHLGGDKPWWHIPAADRKNKVAHDVPLSPLAVSLFEGLSREAQGSEWACATKKGAKTGRLAPTSFANTVRRLFTIKVAGEVYLTLPGGPVVPHDMRRSAKLLASRCDAKADWAEQEMMILGHSPPTKVAAHYDIRPDPVRHRKIMESMSALVMRLVAEKDAGNVVRISSKGA